MAGLSFGFLIGVVCGLISFIPYAGSLTALVVSLSIALAQFFPESGRIGIVVGIVFVANSSRAMCSPRNFVGHSVGLRTRYG